ncbi:peptidyl-prolyl cis-trans isomerase B (cyclophilin B) [Desulfonatronum thiosulfatophilum]|uniref:Peptidyl-prolyl cis-trans isomerase n=1 Tax=Desulfonatronum thiosulfatophilum TaxID=617002 RepID=A0A1G6CWE7_9BACT|nr:peptidylprolyl isomerase [Desulfonatronum thiosulfatophilum]SDB37171.1 peptidyl-prolyl cis-trans isomerase B (cyclophilin B) [Desulfonatronum thiosulfatophilum]
MENPFVLLETNLGDLLIELFPDKAPQTVANFLRYVDQGHYDGTIFHRVVRGFVIQGGGYDRSLNKKPTHPPIPNEARNGLTNHKDSVAMARGPEKDSATDEFFINAADNGADLDHQDDSDEGFGYAVFGQVVEGSEVVKKINWKVVKATDEFPELPKDEVYIISAKRFE